jgi:hypothetical protein
MYFFCLVEELELKLEIKNWKYLQQKKMQSDTLRNYIMIRQGTSGQKGEK